MKARQQLYSVLNAHRAADDKERVDLERMRMLIEDLDAPFSRAQPSAHFTGSAVVVAPDRSKVCLIHHGKLNRWLQPGGHSEETDGGDLQATALREAREETGLEVALHPTAPRPLDVDAHRIPERKDEPAHVHLDLRYLVVAENPEALAHSDESRGAKWMTWEEALAVADEPALKRLLLKAKQA
jgi:8-oxo-dGTP pyrophosphatase MutT (NUDIX family)